MATFLALTQDLARQSGTLAGGVTIPTITNLTGRGEKMADWIRKAWVNIQNERSDWPWMQEEALVALTIGKTTYTAAELMGDAAARFGQWNGDRREGHRIYRPVTVYDAVEGRADQQEVRQIGYLDWKERYGRGVHDANRPTEWSVDNRQRFVIGATPDKAYAATVEYRMSPQILTGSDDVPELPVRYHHAIVWEAMKLLGIADESPATTGTAVGEYVLARQSLNRDYLPEIKIGTRPLV